MSQIRKTRAVDRLTMCWSFSFMAMATIVNRWPISLPRANTRYCSLGVSDSYLMLLIQTTWLYVSCLHVQLYAGQIVVTRKAKNVPRFRNMIVIFINNIPCICWSIRVETLHHLSHVQNMSFLARIPYTCML